MTEKSKPYIRKTFWAIIASNLLHEPLASLYPLLPFILLKNLGATALQIVFFTMLKPVSSLFSFYWSEKVSQKKHSLYRNLLGASLLSRVPFLLALCFDNVWLLIMASTIYMIYMRAGIPSWMEILKRNLPSRHLEKYFAIGSAIGYAEGALIAISIGSLLDHHIHLWKILFGIALLLGLIASLIQASLSSKEEPPEAIESSKESPWEKFKRPWVDCFSLMKNHSNFRKFQWAFMIGGMGLMVIQPVIPIFFAETLKLSYKDLMIAYTICKGLGFVASSPLWSRALGRLPISLFTSLVLVGFALFALSILLATYSYLFIFLAYLFYGVAQAGSHLIWHLSGPLFANENESSRFSGVNIVMVGIRGVLGPPLGGLLCALFGPAIVLILSVILCLSGTGSLFLRHLETEDGLRKKLTC
ncbi:MAG: MFS transporter [Verrucomicrobia bacterium]|nr:MFS transporter [Verrucomicrobiota bacterium]